MSRKKYRSKSPPPVKNSGYSDGGASMTRNTIKTYQPKHYSAKEDIDRNLQTLRDRAHDLAINSPIGAAVIHTQATNVIGVGLKLFPRIKAETLGMTPSQAREWSRKTKQEFELWANSAPACDFMRRNNFYELQRIAFTSYLVDGDSFCLFRRRLPTAFNPYSLRLQIIEAGRVSNPLQGGLAVSNVEMRKVGSTNRIVNGIEVDRQGAQVAIWIANRYWNEPTSLDSELKWQRVRWFGRDSGERNVLHICADTRPDQFRGVPILAPAIEPLKQVARYADAELTSAIIKSFFSIFFTQPISNQGVDNILGDRDNDGAVVDVNEYKLGPATISALPRGVDVKAVNNANAQNTFDSFISAFVKQIGAAVGIPFEVLLKSFTASYSASRAALLQAQDEFKQRKAWFIQDFCRPVYELWLAEAVATGRISAPGFFDDPIKKAAWSAAGWFNEQTRYIDPQKEFNGAKLQLELGLTTREQLAAELCGTDYWDIVDALKIENDALAKVNPSRE